MRGRHEARQVLQPVRVDAPDEGADDFGAGRDDDHDERLSPQRGRRVPAGEAERDPRTAAEHELTPGADLRVDREQHREVAHDRQSAGHLSA